ncbi:TolC family protein [Spirosoma aerophilum]
MRIILTTVIAGLFGLAGYAQAPTRARAVPKPPVAPPTNPITNTVVQVDSFQLDLSQDVAAQLMSFEDIYEIAIAYSPLIKFQNENAVALNAAYRLSKIEILNRLTGFVNYSNGNQAILSTSVNNGDALGTISNGYRAGVNASISLYDLFGRPLQIKQARANYQISMYQKDIAKMQLRRELITAYQDLITSQQVLKVRISEEQTSFAAYQIADIDARQGRKSPEELAGSNSRYSQAKTIAEEARGNFVKNAYYLETLTGVSIQQLKRK